MCCWMKPRFSSNIEGKLSRGKFSSLNAADIPMRLPVGTLRLSAGTIELPQLQHTSRSPPPPRCPPLAFTGVHKPPRSLAADVGLTISLTLELRTAAIAFSRSLPQECRKAVALAVGVVGVPGSSPPPSRTNELGRDDGSGFAAAAPISDARREILRMFTVTRVVSLVLRALPPGVEVCAWVDEEVAALSGRSTAMLSR